MIQNKPMPRYIELLRHRGQVKPPNQARPDPIDEQWRQRNALEDGENLRRCMHWVCLQKLGMRKAQSFELIYMDRPGAK